MTNVKAQSALYIKLKHAGVITSRQTDDDKLWRSKMCIVEQAHLKSVDGSFFLRLQGKAQKVKQSAGGRSYE